jgi:hypothetical protein
MIDETDYPTILEAYSDIEQNNLSVALYIEFCDDLRRDCEAAYHLLITDHNHILQFCIGLRPEIKIHVARINNISRTRVLKIATLAEQHKWVEINSWITQYNTAFPTINW